MKRENSRRLTRAEVRHFIDVVVRNGIDPVAVETFFSLLGFQPVDPIERQLELMVERLVESCGDLTGVGAEPSEGQFSGEVHRFLESNYSDLDLGDEDFWTYLSVRFFWPFVKIRQASSWKKAEGTPDPASEDPDERMSLERYLTGSDHYHLPLRMYLRAQAVLSNGDYSLAGIPGTDFWRSQILAVRTSHYPELARAVAEEQRDQELNIEEQRPCGRLINRLRSNVEFSVLDFSECCDIIRPLWRRSQNTTRQASTPRRRSTK